jgi:hypothetical protein
MIERKISKIQFKDFMNLEDLVNYCIENDIDVLIDDSSEERVGYLISDLHLVWAKFRYKFDESKKYK